MKKICVFIVLAVGVIAFGVHRASALPPINVQFHEKYSALKGEVEAKLGTESTAKCNVCHVGKSKKDKNEYGKAVGKYVTKAAITKIKEDAGDDLDKAQAETKKYILEGLDKTEAEKSPSGKTYGEILKSGKLPIE